ncbi:MAG TPA: M23 family metallopeptidase [Flavilitoribacter sp.]|nr:M23 family metallopeptidase [Flavilitoribacter sp.]HMQ87132.1 M23 family metallopeptidase [Flavilitoribacter sp.]
MGIKILFFLLFAAAIIFLQNSCCSDPQAGLLSEGTYRIPYANGTKVKVTRDHCTHSPKNRIDMRGTGGQGPYRVVAAQSGVIRFISDGNSANCCDGSCANNYVWIQHSNGEWTKYSHLTTGSVTGDAGLSVGDQVSIGAFLGYEGDVGRACGVHLHFEVAVPNDPNNPLNSGNGGFINGVNRVPVICGIGSVAFERNHIYTAANCLLN